MSKSILACLFTMWLFSHSEEWPLVVRSKKLVTVLAAFIVLLIVPSLSVAGPVNYIYDNDGRLLKAVSESGDTAMYKYDEVGNLVSIDRQAARKLPPQVTSISPEVFFKISVNPTNIRVILTGENLITADRVFFDNSGVSVGSFSATETEITADIAVSPDAPLGATTMNIRTFFGDASISVDVARLIFDPSQIAVPVGATVGATAKIEGLARDYTVALNNQTPDIISAPQTVTIPAGGNSPFAINAIKEGTGIITAENTGVSVYVTTAFTGNVTASSNSVSVDFSRQQTVNYGPTISNAVSVAIYSNKSTVVGPVLSPIVSIDFSKIQNAYYGPVISQPVSTIIDQ